MIQPSRELKSQRRPSLKPRTGMDCEVADQKNSTSAKETLKPDWSMFRTTWRKIMQTGNVSFGQRRWNQSLLDIETLHIFGERRERSRTPKWNTVVGVYCRGDASVQLELWSSPRKKKGWVKVLKEIFKESAAKLGLGHWFVLQHDDDPKCVAPGEELALEDQSERYWLACSKPWYESGLGRTEDQGPFQKIKSRGA